MNMRKAAFEEEHEHDTMYDCEMDDLYPYEAEPSIWYTWFKWLSFILARRMSEKHVDALLFSTALHAPRGGNKDRDPMVHEKTHLQILLVIFFALSLQQ